MEEKRFTLRMNGQLFEDISALAKKNRRSVAKEIECAIAKYVRSETFEDIKNQVRLGEFGGTMTDEERHALFNVLKAIEERYDYLMLPKDKLFDKESKQL